MHGEIARSMRAMERAPTERAVSAFMSLPAESKQEFVRRICEIARAPVMTFTPEEK
jgi:hypothetical protein